MFSFRIEARLQSYSSSPVKIFSPERNSHTDCRSLLIVKGTVKLLNGRNKNAADFVISRIYWKKWRGRRDSNSRPPA